MVCLLLEFREAICIFLPPNVGRRDDIFVSSLFLQVDLEQQFPCFAPAFVRLLVWSLGKASSTNTQVILDNSIQLPETQPLVFLRLFLGFERILRR